MAEKARERAFLRMLEHAAAAGGNGMMDVFCLSCFSHSALCVQHKVSTALLSQKKKENVAH
jgi:uncharacterized protein YbjQ (UPF0145 family)